MKVRGTFFLSTAGTRFDVWQKAYNRGDVMTRGFSLSVDLCKLILLRLKISNRIKFVEENIGLPNYRNFTDRNFR